MWDKLKGFTLVFMVVLLSLVFVVQFGGSQAEGCASGGASFAAQVYGQTLTKGDFDAAYALGGFRRFPLAAQKALNIPEAVLSGLIDRKLLAQEARKIGFSVSESEVMQSLAKDGVVLLTLGIDASPALPQGEIPISLNDENGNFDTEAAKRFIQNHLRRSISEFSESQIEERLAARMRELIASSIAISDTELWNAFAHEHDNATIEYIRFTPSYYESQVVQKPSEQRAWIKKNANHIKAEYEKNEHLYTNLDAQVRAQHILIKTPSDKNEAETQAARKRIEKLYRRIKSGSDFSTLASQHSEDSASAKKGGDLGYNSRGRMVAEFDKAQFALEEGEISEIVETQYGFHIIKVTGKREGNVSLEDATQEIGESLYADYLAEELALASAKSVLEEWRKNPDTEEIEAYLESLSEEQSSTLAPVLRSSRKVTRGEDPIPGLNEPTLASAVFAMPEEAEFSIEPLRVNNEYIIFRVIDRERPIKDEFTLETKQALAEELRTKKKTEAIWLYVQGLRNQAEAAGSIEVNPKITQLPDTDSSPS